MANALCYLNNQYFSYHTFCNILNKTTNFTFICRFVSLIPIQENIIENYNYDGIWLTVDVSTLHLIYGYICSNFPQNKITLGTFRFMNITPKRRSRYHYQIFVITSTNNLTFCIVIFLIEKKILRNK